ncbi:hypothetical protein EU508_00650 [Pseudoalteromonas fuliginea]|uniref:Phage abortive infection protein n=1 Tax=Pseudoalteromonas fuliginea TaxID=1872678 RepID=A0AB73BM39_9GAMM|nr:hypothetical protein [Pseudoalteromonas fuliginea]KAA1165475.1 hypothetical protein EU508_00650 [Pseudoalteromonas fuliginea]
MEQFKFKPFMQVIIGAVVFFIILIGVYSFTFFNVGNFVNSESWSHFGGFFGGVAAPFLSFLSIIVIYMSTKLQLAQNNDEIKRGQLHSETQLDLAQFTVLENKIQNYLQVKQDIQGIVSHPDVKKALEQSDTTFIFEPRKVGSYVEYGDYIFPQQINSLEILKYLGGVFKDEKGNTDISKVVDLVMTNNQFLVQNQIQSITSAIAHILIIEDKLTEKKYPSYLLKYHFSFMFSIANTLWDYGLIDPIHFRRISLYTCMPHRPSDLTKMPKSIEETIYQSLKNDCEELEDISKYTFSNKFHSDNHTYFEVVGSDKNYIFSPKKGWYETQLTLETFLTPFPAN